MRPSDDTPTVDGKSDEEAIRGAWQVESVDDGRKVLSGESAPDMTMEFRPDGRLVWAMTAGRILDVTFHLDTAARPKAIDVTEERIAMPGVYDLDGDTLRLCLAGGGQTARPTELKADGHNLTVITLKRVRTEVEGRSPAPPPPSEDRGLSPPLATNGMRKAFAKLTEILVARGLLSDEDLDAILLAAVDFPEGK